MVCAEIYRTVFTRISKHCVRDITVKIGLFYTERIVVKTRQDFVLYKLNKVNFKSRRQNLE